MSDPTGSQAPQSFTFSLTHAAAQEADLGLRIAALEDRIANIKRHCTRFCDSQVWEHIFSVSTDTDDLDQLGRALIRLSTILPELRRAMLKRDIAVLAREAPGELLGLAGDFSHEIDEIDNFLEGLDE